MKLDTEEPKFSEHYQDHAGNNGNITFLIAINKICEQRRKAYNLARWNKFFEYMMNKTSCEIARVSRDLWSFVIFGKL